jgi:hypothetical protein
LKNPFVAVAVTGVDAAAARLQMREELHPAAIVDRWQRTHITKFSVIERNRRHLTRGRDCKDTHVEKGIGVSAKRDQTMIIESNTRP